MKTVLLFGVFDRLHPGHEAMLRQAWNHGDKIVIALAKDGVIKELKKKMPTQSYEERVEALESSGLVDEIVPGDDKQGEYSVLDRVKPDIIAFGYDQNALQENLLAFLKKKEKSIATVTLSPFEPDKYKSSLLV